MINTVLTIRQLILKKIGKTLINKTLSDAENMAKLVEQLPEVTLWDNIDDEKYGNFYRNIHGIIEHTHYHLGQIALIKMIIIADISSDTAAI